MRRHYLIAIAAVLIAGCASQGPKQPADANEQACVREYRVGSQIPKITCLTPQTDAEHERMIDQLETQSRPRPGAAAKGGGS